MQFICFSHIINSRTTSLSCIAKKHSMFDLLYKSKTRSLIAQLIVAASVCALITYAIHNAMINLRAQGIAFGFDFLKHRAGFGIIQSMLDYDENSTYGRAFLVGLTNTFLVSGLGIFLATLLGFLIGVARLSPNWLIKKIASVYIETFRNLPLLLQIFFWYFVILRSLPNPRSSFSLAESFFLNNRGFYIPKPSNSLYIYLFIISSSLAIITSVVTLLKKKLDDQTKLFDMRHLLIFLMLLVSILSIILPHWHKPSLQGFNFSGGIALIPELVALLGALTIYTASFIAETVRAGIEAIPKGQWEAALSLGLNRRQTLGSVIIPQALRIIVPPLTSQYLNLTKNSSLAAAIAYPDLVSVFAGTVLNQTGQAVEVIAITMSVYLSISLSISTFMNWFNRKFALIYNH